MLREVIRPDGQIADEAQQEQVLLGQIKHPLIILDPRAGFHDHGACHAMWLRNRLVIVW
jgi:hypothetical protein